MPILFSSRYRVIERPTPAYYAVPAANLAPLIARAPSLGTKQHTRTLASRKDRRTATANHLEK